MVRSIRTGRMKSKLQDLPKVFDYNGWSASDLHFN